MDNSDDVLSQPHAFHLNLPPHFMDEDGVPLVTKFAANKAKQVVEVAFSIQLNESLFEHREGTDNDNSTEAMDIDDEEEETPLPAADIPPDSLLSVSKRCSRLVSLLSALENLKFGGISQDVLMDIILHLLRLVTATITYEIYEDGRQKATLHYENVGAVLRFGTGHDYKSQVPSGDLTYELPATEGELDEHLKQDFALPTPSREVLLLSLINLLSNKGPLRSVSNSSIYIGENKSTRRSLLLLQWKPLLRMLLRTAPYLDEQAFGHPVKDSNSRTGTILKRTVQLIRDARHFFEQGVRPPEAVDEALQDQTAREIWNVVESDILFHSHTHACYRGTILLYLFQPTRCTEEFYLSVLPHWWNAWTNIDRCPEYDFLWLALFCRARKHVQEYDWSMVRKRLLTHCQYWLQLPIGGAAMDKSFPRASNPRSRSCPPRLKVFAGISSSYDEGIDFVSKVTKLLVAGLGTGDVVKRHGGPGITGGTDDVLRFLSFVTPYFNPSNIGQWTFTLGAFLHYFAYEFSSRLGSAAGNVSLEKSRPEVVKAFRCVQKGSHCAPVPPHEVVALMDALLPLCQQALYSKNGHVGRAGEAAMLYLVQIDPVHTTPAFVDFACRALDISAVNLSHQAPSALSALSRLVQPALRSDSSILLSRLPEILRLSLAGIDSNDQNKTIRTLILYRGISSWIPIGGKPENWLTIETPESSEAGGDGTFRLGLDLFEATSALSKSEEYKKALEGLPETSLLRQSIAIEPIDMEMRQLLLDEATSAMGDWVLDFLERVFDLLRSSGEREKTAKRASGVASRHSSADVHQARNFSRVLKECLLQVFAGMDDDTHALSVRTVARFLEEETLPAAAKDASLLCQAVAACRGIDVGSPGLDALVPLLTDDLSRHSAKTVTYRLRCLAGAVRSASHSVERHRKAITGAIKFALSGDDRHLFKTGCKLLRHTLSSLVESYPIAVDSMPRIFRPRKSSGPVDLGRSAQLHDDPVLWHKPGKESVSFAWELFETQVVKRLNVLCSPNAGTEIGRSRLLNDLDVNELRRCLRVIRYSIRGGASILLDSITVSLEAEDIVPYEKACRDIIAQLDETTQAGILALRGKFCSFLVVLSTVIASETLYPDGVAGLPESDSYRKTFPVISSDPKVCKETSDISLLLLTRRGAAFRSQEARTIWKAQKQLGADFMLCSQVDHISNALQCASFFTESNIVLYKDGEDAGKTLPRRLLVARVQLFHDSLQRSASFEIPKRLRRLERNAKGSKMRLFNVKSNFQSMVENLEKILASSGPSSLDTYEGLADGLYALCCHSNTQVRASALSVIDYTMTRFGWLVAVRVPRLLSGLALKDEGMNGKFGIPCCSLLVDHLNHQGKRKRLAEAIKGVCSILSLSRAMKHVLQSEKMRLQFSQTVCGTERLLGLLPPEEMQKVVHYLQAVFSPFRSKYFFHPRITPSDVDCHTESKKIALDILSEKPAEESLENGENGVDAHWRKKLLACWFLQSFIDHFDFIRDEALDTSRIWLTCFRIIETEKGQPLQRAVLGLFGRLVQLGAGNVLFRDKMKEESFCQMFSEALVYDHKEDASIGGGHDAQWAAGVEEIIRDASRNLAPRTLFPFQRTSQALGSFKASHAQLVELTLSSIDKDAANEAARILLKVSKQFAVAPSSEDQRNLQITSAEIFAGVCGSFLRKPDVYSFGWDDCLIPHLEDIMGRLPFSLSGAFFDAIRYALQFAPPNLFYPLTKWLVDRVCSTLWQPSAADHQSEGMSTADAASNGSSHGTEGFTAQSKWLYLFSAVLIEMDESEAGNASRVAWYKKTLCHDGKLSLSDDLVQNDPELEFSWMLVIEKLLPRLTAALGHPFDSCRDHISRCLFRICYCHRKRERMTASLVPSRSNSIVEGVEPTCNDPGLIVVQKLAALEKSEGWAFYDRFNALSTARRFIAYSVHLGEAKFEFSDYVIPLLPLAFEAIKSTVDETPSIDNESQEQDAAVRALEADVIKSYRGTIAEVSVTAVISYGRSFDMLRVLDIVEDASKHVQWQVRHAAMHFLRCFQGAHKFLFPMEYRERTMSIVASVLADDRREVSSAAMSSLTGILAAAPVDEVARLVEKYSALADRSKMRRKNKKVAEKINSVNYDKQEMLVGQTREEKRSKDQKTSVFFLCAAIMAQPYDTPPYVPIALASISKHSFERNAPLGVRDTVKRCCAEYKKTHMSDNWELHRSMFTQEQLEAFEDVVSTPHYYA